MAIKWKITKAAYDKLSDDMKEHYGEMEGGKHYELEVTGMPDTGEGDAPELKRALERVRADLKDAETERDEAVTKLDEVEKNKGKGDRDLDRLTRRHELALKEAKDTAEAKIATFKASITKLLKGNTSMAMANEISNAPKLLQDKIDARLTVEFPEDGEPKLVILGADGKPAAADFTLDKLKAEIVANPDYKSIIVASKAKGGGATPPSTTAQPPNSARSGEQTQNADLTKMPRTDFVQAIRDRVASKQAAQ
jgi:hypothetical protein